MNPAVQVAAFSYEVPQDPMKQLVTTGEHFEQMMRQLWDNPTRIFDHETSGLRWWMPDRGRSCGIAFGCFEGNRVKSWYVPTRHLTGEVQLDISLIQQPVQQIFADPYATWIAHHLKYDDHIGRREGWYIGGSRYCTQMAARLYDPNSLVGLKKRAHSDLGIAQADLWEKRLDVEIKRLAKARKLNIRPYKDQFGYAEVSITLAGHYACHDIDYTGSLWQLYESKGLSSFYSRVWPTEMGLNEALADMEEYGQPINVEYLEDLRDRLTMVTSTLLEQIQQKIGNKNFNPGSDPEVRELIYERLGAPKFKKTKGGDNWSVDREVLEAYENLNPVMPILKTWREAEKIRTTWTDSILTSVDANHILHGSFKPDGTATGRLSSSDPNLQNFIHDSDDRAVKHTGKKVEDGGVDPWSIREAFTMRKVGGLVIPRLAFDYSQIELRVLTWFSQEPNMVDAYLRNQDIHERTQDEVEKLTGRRPPRRRAKVAVFGIVYGLTESGLARQAKISLEEAASFMDAFFHQYTSINPFRKKFWVECRMRGNGYMNPFGRTRSLPWLSSSVDWQRRSAERRLFGALIQGTAGELTKESIVRIHRWIKESGSGARLVGTIHDEISIDCPPGELTIVAPKVKQLMEDYPEFHPIPIVVNGEYSTVNWAHKYPLPLAA